MVKVLHAKVAHIFYKGLDLFISLHCFIVNVVNMHYIRNKTAKKKRWVTYQGNILEDTKALSTHSIGTSHSSPLGGLPHFVAVISVEVSGQLLLLEHTTGFNKIREAQRPEGQRLRSLLNQLDVTTSTCCICLEIGEDVATSPMTLITAEANYAWLFLLRDLGTEGTLRWRRGGALDHLWPHSFGNEKADVVKAYWV